MLAILFFDRIHRILGICDPVLSCESCRKIKLPSGKEPGLPTWDKFDAKLMNYT